jgi:hypothetical protein
MGGLYYMLNMVLALASTYISIFLFDAGEGAEGEFEIDKAQMWKASGALGMLWLLGQCVFFANIRPKYLRTFFSTESGNDFAASYFTKSEKHETQCEVFGINENKWTAIRPDVKAWVMDHWWIWVEKKPTWFVDK